MHPMTGYVLATAAAMLGGYSVFVERNALALTRLEISYSHLPRSFDGLTILQLSDTHISHWWKIERKMEKIVSSLDADILVLTGDLAVSTKGANLLREFLERVRPGRETFAVYGNSEHKGDFGKHRRADLTWNRLRILANEHLTIEKNGERLVIAGIDDPFTKHDDLGKALEEAPKDAFTVLLAHTPDVAGDAAQAGVDLVLSGHTHGGQVRFPIIGALYSHLHKHKPLVQGLFEGKRLSRIIRMDAGEMRVYVSRGIGISNLPARFLCPPEIVHITLRSAT